MKLLMITGDRALAEGKRGAFYNTIEEFHKYWDRIDIICPKVSGSLTSEPLFGNVYIYPSPWHLIFQPWFILKKGLEIYKEQNFKLITVQEYPPFYNGIGTRFLWWKIKIPYVMEIHHIIGYPQSSSAKEEIYKILTRLFIKFDSDKAKAIRVVNQDQVPKFLTESGVIKEKIVYSPSMYVDLEIFKPLNLAKEYDLIFVGRLVENKGINLFLEAVRKLNSKAIIVGAGSLEEQVRLKIKDWNLNIKMHGWAKDQKEISELINKSKILVMSSYNEGGPRVVAEAMACGVPVLATPVGIVPDLVRNNIGKITDWDADDIADKAAEIIKDYEIYKNSGVETVKRFEKVTAIKNYAEKLKELV